MAIILKKLGSIDQVVFIARHKYNIEIFSCKVNNDYFFNNLKMTYVNNYNSF